MYKYVFRLTFEEMYEKDGETFQTCLDLGYFSKRQRAVEAIQVFANKVGFSGKPLECFKVCKKRLEVVNNSLKKEDLNFPISKNFSCYDIPVEDSELESIFYELYHAGIDKDGIDHCECIGIYPLRSQAIDKINRLQTKQYYEKYKDGFDISIECLDVINPLWIEGFDREW